MKKVHFILIALILSGCSKLTNVEVDIPFSQTLDGSQYPDSAHYPAGLGGNYIINFPTVAVNTNSQQTLQNYNTTADKINSVTLKSVVLQMTAPAGRYMNFLKNISISISADTLANIRIAHKDNIPLGQTTITLDDTTASMKPYFLQNKFYVNITATLDSIPPSGTNITSNIIFHLSANPLN